MRCLTIQFVHSLCRLTACGEEAPTMAEEKHRDVTTAESDGLVSTSVETLPDTASVSC